MADAALLSCVAFLLIRGQGETYQATARKTSLLLIVLGLCVFATSDFIFNIQQSNQAYVEGTWVDMGWPLGMLTIGLAAYLRSSLPKSLAETVQERVQNQSKYLGFGIAQLIPLYLDSTAISCFNDQYHFDQCVTTAPLLSHLKV